MMHEQNHGQYQFVLGKIQSNQNDKDMICWKGEIITRQTLRQNTLMEKREFFYLVNIYLMYNSMFLQLFQKWENILSHPLILILYIALTEDDVLSRLLFLNKK